MMIERDSLSGISDEAGLKDMALKTLYHENAQHAIGRITNNDLLLDFIIRTHFEKIAIDVIPRLTDDSKKTAALKAVNKGIREYAIDCVRNQDTLRTIALNDTSTELGVKAATKIDDETILASILTECQNDTINDIVAEKLRDIDDRTELRPESANALDRWEYNELVNKNRNTIYECTGCHKHVLKRTQKCPHCGGYLHGIICSGCGYKGGKRDFKKDRCPKCGSISKLYG